MGIKRYFNDFISRIKNGGNDNYVISVSREMLSLSKNDRLIAAIDWRDISKLVALKRDCVTYEEVLICVLHSDDGQHGTTFSEFWSGYEELVEEITRRYNLNVNWQEKQNEYVFDTNTWLLWQRN